MVKKSTAWKPTCKRFVAFLDIMGFRDMVLRNPHEHVLDTLEQFRLTIKKIKQEARERLAGEYSGWDTFEDSIIWPVFFSDSVLLFSSDDSIGSVDHILWGVYLVISRALMKGIPIKGAIAYGEQTADFNKSLYFGRPLIDAYELQKDIVIYGAVLHHTMEKFLIDNELLEKVNSNILKYPTPLKQGIITHYLVNLLRYIPTDSKLKNSLPNLYCNVSGYARRYIDNTLEYFDWCEKQKEP